MTQDTITESTGYLLARTCKSHRNKAGELLAAIDLYVGQEILLIHLWRENGQSLYEMAECMRVQPATVSRMIERMEKAGLVERRKDLDDGRVSRVFLTEAGQKMREPVHRVWAELESICMANLTSDEKILLRRLLLQVEQNLGEGV